MPPPTPDQQKKLDAFDRAADPLERAYATALVEAFTRMQNLVSLEALADAIGRGDRKGAVKAVNLTNIETPLTEHAWPVTQRTLKAGRKLAREFVAPRVKD